jgi:Family of unknown function (DUF6455)
MDDPDVTLAWSLTRGMARTLGFNLVEAVTDGWYSREELARVVDTCAHCGLAEQCQRWLAVTPKATTLPFYCAIKHDLEALAP